MHPTDELLGRGPARAQIDDCLRQAESGAGRLILLTGEPGIGKSALARSVVPLAKELGFDVVQGRAWEAADAPAYFPLWSALESLELGFDWRTASSDADTFVLWDAVLASLARVTAARPRLWIAEDLHAADAQTLDLLSFLAQPLRALRCVLLATLRPRDASLGSAEPSRIARLIREGLEIPLSPLQPAEVAALATRLAGRTLPPDLVSELSARTGGNPLFVVECARALRAGERGAHLPGSVAQLVLDRVQRLPDATRVLLQAAAVIGEEAGATLLGKMTGRLPASAIDALKPALVAGMLEELEPGRFRFSHRIVRDAIAGSIPAEVLVDLHDLAEKGLAAIGESPSVALSRAQHALAALAPGREAAALALADRAVALLVSEGAFDRAFSLTERVLEHRREGSFPRASSADLESAATLALSAGLFTPSRCLSLEAVVLARANGDGEAFGRAVLILGGDLHPGLVDSFLVQHLEEALSRLPPGASALRCRVAARLAAALQPARDPSVPVAMAREAILEARSIGEKDLLGDVLFVAGSAIADYGGIAETHDLAAELLALSLAKDDAARALRAYARLLVSEGEEGKFDSLEKHLDEMLVLAGRVGHPRLAWRPLLLASMWAIAKGQLEESERRIGEVERLARLTDDPALQISLPAHLQMRAIALGQREVVRRSLAEMDQVADFPGSWFVRPLIHATAGARGGDRADGQAAWNRLSFEVMIGTCEGSWVGLLGELAAVHGTSEQRQTLREILRATPDSHAFMGHIPMIYEGPYRRSLGLLDASLGDLASAEKKLEESLAFCRKHGLKPWQCRIGLELAEVLKSSGRASEASALVAEASRIAEEIGAPGLLPDKGRSVGSGAAASIPAPSASLSMRREGQVWRLARGGAEIAVPDRRGMALLAKLIGRPGEELHVLAFGTGTGEALVETSPVEAIDLKAAQAYRRRLAELEEKLATAEQAGDLDGAERAERERDFLQQELARGLGLGGRVRQVGSASEKARVNVQRRLKDAIARIGEVDVAMGAYLRKAVRTGTYCSFRP